MLLGTRLYFNFHPQAIQTQADFMRQIDLVQRELGQRGKAKATEGAPSPDPVTDSTEAPATPARALAPAVAAHSYTPSVQQSPPGAAVQPAWSTDQQDQTPIVQQLLEREERFRQEASAEMAVLRHELQREMEQKMEQLRSELSPRKAVSAEQLRDLQSRLDAIHAAQLITDDELYILDNSIGVSLCTSRL